MLILVPAILDAVRYFKPDARWAVWGSRGAKIGGVALIFRARRGARAGSTSTRPRTERERHRPFDRDLAVDARDAVEDAHPAAQAADDRFDLDDVTRVDGAAVAHALDPGEERQPLAVLRLGEDQNRADLGDGFGEDRRRQRRRFAVAVRQVAFVERDVLDPHDPLVHFDLGDPIDEEERIAVGKDPLDRGVVEREFQALHEVASIIGTPGRMRPDTTAPREQEMLTTLIDLGRQVAAVLDFEELVAQIPKLIARLIQFDAFAVYLLDERRAELRVAYSVGYPDGRTRPG